MGLPDDTLLEWSQDENPSIIFNPLPESIDLLLGWPDATGKDITDKVLYEKLGDIELVGATRGSSLYKIHFRQHQANDYVIFNGISGE